MACQESIKAICRSLRAIQKAIADAPKEAENEEPLVYYRGNISSRDLDCLNGRNWLNDCIINRYMGLMVAHYSPAPFVAISSFFLETFSKEKPEKLPGLQTHLLKLMRTELGNKNAMRFSLDNFTMTHLSDAMVR